MLRQLIAITVIAAILAVTYLIFPPIPEPNQQEEPAAFEIATTTTETAPAIVSPIEEKPAPAPPTPLPMPKLELPEILPQPKPGLPVTPAPPQPTTQSAIPKPQINEEEIMKAIVRVGCGSTFGSGFVIKSGETRYAVTAAHVVIDRIEAKNFFCNVIFPRKDENGNFVEAHYRAGRIISPDTTETNYKEKGVDLAILKILPLENKTEDLDRFPTGFPYINYPFCPSDTLGDDIILWGYSANLGTTFSPGGVLSKFLGHLIQYADVIGITKKSSSEFSGGFVYLPKMESSLDLASQHQINIILSNNNFSGASGGLVFNASKACVIGINIATLVQSNQVFGFVTNPNFAPIKEWLNQVIGVVTTP